MNKKIIDVIENNLTGDFDHDFNYLMNEAAHFQRMKGTEELVKEILMVFKKHLGEKGRVRMMEVAAAQIDARHKKYKRAIEAMKEKKFSEASRLLTELIDTFPFKRSDDEAAYLQFNHIVERAIYQEIHSDIKIHQYEEPVSIFYYQLAYVLRETKDYEGTLEMVEKALELNPVCFDYFVLEADTHKRLGNLQGFMESIIKALSYAFNTLQFGRGYFLLAGYYYEIGDYELAYYLYEKTISYIDMDYAIKAMKKIESQYSNIAAKSPEEINELLKAYNIPLTPTQEVIDALTQILADTAEPGLEELHNSIEQLYSDIIEDKTNDIH